MQFHGHLLGEMEQLASTAPRKGVANQTSNPNANNNQEPQVKGLQANQPLLAGSLAKRIRVAQRVRIACLSRAGFQTSPQGASHAPVWVTLSRIAQTAKEITPRVRVSPKVREMAKARIIPQVQTRKEVIL